MGVSKNSGFSPQIIHFNRVFHYFHHPFWGTPIFGNIHKSHVCRQIFQSHGVKGSLFMVCLFVCLFVFFGKSFVLLSRNTVFDGVVCGDSFVHYFQPSPNVRRANVLRTVCFLHHFVSYHEVAKVQKLLSSHQMSSWLRHYYSKICFK